MSPRRGASAEYALESQQVKALWEVCSTLEDRVIIGAQIWLGLRASELAHIKAAWITSEGDLRIPAFQMCKCAECLAERGGEWRPKTKSGARTLPIPSALKGNLIEFLRQRPNGLELSRVSIYHRTKALLKKAGVEKEGLAGNVPFPHALRSTCASMLAASGMSAAALCYTMGWKSIAIGVRYITVAHAKAEAHKQIRQIFG